MQWLGNIINMISKIFDSVNKDIYSKTKNPFFGAYAIVWIARNWRPIYSFFYFEKDVTLAEKIQAFDNYFSFSDIWSQIFANAGLALIVLILGYLFTNIARYFVNLFDKRLTPWVYKKTDSSSIVLKSEYEKLEERLQKQKDTTEKEKKEKYLLEEEVESLKEQVQEVIRANDEPRVYDEEIIDKGLHSASEFELYFQKLADKDLKETFIDYLDQSGGQKYLSVDNNILYLRKIGLIKLTYNSAGNAAQVAPTTLGQEVARLIRREL